MTTTRTLTPEDRTRIAADLDIDADRVDSWTGRPYYGPDARLARRLAARMLREGATVAAIVARTSDLDADLFADLVEDGFA